jgi:parvulin-like peptidyl-prolyl isomerase
MGGQIIKNPIGLVCLAVLILWLTSGCSKDDPDNKTVEEGVREKPSVVATVGNNAITVSDFKSYLSDRPTPYRYRVSKKDIEKRLDEMVLEEVLYQEALRLKLDQDPEMRQRIRKMLTQKLMDDKINREVWSREIEEVELQEYYDQHWDEFNRPEQVRLVDIFIAVPSGASSEERADLRTKTQSILDEARAVKNQRSGFGNLVRKYSDKPATYRMGDTGFFNAEGKPGGIDRSPAAAAF